MSKEVLLPDMGDGVTSGTIISLPVNVGDSINEGDVILEVETDKAVLPVPSPFTGTIEKIIAKENDTISVGDPILVLTVDDADGAKEKPQTKGEEPAKSQEIPLPTVKTKDNNAPKEEKTADEGAPKKDSPKEHVFNADFSSIAAAPSARKLARELGIDLRCVTGSKRGGRINAQDVKLYAKEQMTSPTGTTTQKSRPLPDFSAFGKVTEQPLTNLRKTIAAQMQYAWSTIPHVHQTIEIDLEEITRYQKKHAKSFKEANSSLSVTLFLIKALTICLKEFPSFNSSLDMERGVLWMKNYFNIGVAVDTPAGLIVPVIKDADTKSIFTLGVELKEIAQKARKRTIGPNDLKGSSMTISNLGGLKAGVFTPIVNPPEVAILGVATTKKHLAIIDDDVQEREILPLILGYDHRVIDGADAARFVVRLKELMENTELIFMGMITKKDAGENK